MEADLGIVEEEEVVDSMFSAKFVIVPVMTPPIAIIASMQLTLLQNLLHILKETPINTYAHLLLTTLHGHRAP